MADITPTRQLDCRGQSCPLPVGQAEHALANMQSGEILEILGTDPKAREELETFAKNHGHHFLGYEDTPEFTRYMIKHA
jgi:tRNA 2-thiouridine synthesizing protein A